MSLCVYVSVSVSMCLYVRARARACVLLYITHADNAIYSTRTHTVSLKTTPAPCAIGYLWNQAQKKSDQDDTSTDIPHGPYYF